MKDILIVYKPDKGANSVRPEKIKNFLKQHGHFVDSHKIGDGDKNINKLAKNQQLRKKLMPKCLRNILFILNSLLVSWSLARKIRKQGYLTIICETEISSLCFLYLGKEYIKIMDIPSPWVAEWEFSGDLSILIKPFAYWLEKKIYSEADALTFHWDTYTNYVRDHIYEGSNMFKMNWGCEHREKRAKYAGKPRIIFLGKLDGYWNDAKLLSKINKMYKIDIFGSPAPPKELGLNYKGYAPSTDILAEYQFGLITITKDELRKNSFSSKHLDYISYGLPVLTPEWRKDSSLKDVSIYYNENNFLKIIEEYSHKKRWDDISNRCYDRAKEWNWEKNLYPLLNIIDYEKN